MSIKSQQLQIRVTPRQKAALRRSAANAGLDVSSWVLARLLPPVTDRFHDLLRSLEVEANRRFALAELNDVLHTTAPIEFSAMVAAASLDKLSPMLQNYVAAMVELAASRKNLTPPSWVRDITPLDHPHFATSLKSVRPYLLRVSPVPFKRRNIFIDAGIGARV